MNSIESMYADDKKSDDKYEYLDGKYKCHGIDLRYDYIFGQFADITFAYTSYIHLYTLVPINSRYICAIPYKGTRLMIDSRC